jgi:RND superfamily putative drug exporter
LPPSSNATEEAIKGTPLEGAKIHLGGSAAVSKDMRNGSAYDLMIAGISAVTLIFIIILIITGSLVAAITSVGTLLLSLGASFGLSVLLRQDIFGFQLRWMVLAISVILLLVVGSDYNLLMVSRFKEEIHAGIKTGIMESIARPGADLTNAVPIFGATMASFIVSDLPNAGQAGSAVSLGLTV